jgi:hypothetical protein
MRLGGRQALLEEDPERALDSLAKSQMLFSLLKPKGAFVVGFPEAEERIREIDELMEGGG